MKNRRLALILAAGFILRLIPAAFYAHPWDVYIWIKSGELGLHDLNIYKFGSPIDYPWGFYAYPPVWLYWLVVVAILGGDLLSKIFMIKLPIILADLACAVMIYRLAGRLNLSERKALLAAAVWLFNPITYFISAFWGMFDSIAVFFQLLAIDFLLKRRYVHSGVAIGVGAAVKIIPALLLLPVAIYLWKKGERILAVLPRIVLPAALVFAIASTPFLTTPLEYFQALVQHSKSVGGFTYWMALSTLINISNFWFIPLIAFGLIAIAMVKRMRPDEYGLMWAIMLTITSFLATSPKVNIQYVNFLIPQLLLTREFWIRRNMRNNLALLFASALVWIACTWIVLAGFNPAYLGRLYVSESYEIGLPHALIVVAGLFAGTRFIALVMDGLSLQKYDTAYLSKWNVAVYLTVIALGLAAILPTSSGVILPNHPIRIAVPESPDSSFIPGSDESISQFLKYYNVTHVVLVLSPDFVNTYDGFKPSSDVTRYFRFRTEPNKWSQRDLKWLVSELKSEGVEVLLGVYLKAEGTVLRYSVQGFSVEWLRNHSKLIGYQKVILFNETIETASGEKIYGEYFSEKLLKIVDDFGFDGIYLMAWDDWRIRGDRLEHVMPLLESLREDADKPIYVEGPELLNREEVSRLLGKADFIVLKTAFFVKQLYYAAKNNASILNYYDRLESLVNGIPPENRSRILFTVYTFSFVDGWFNPAIELQFEVNKLREIGFEGGYAIYYADSYVPYKLSIKS